MAIMLLVALAAAVAQPPSPVMTTPRVCLDPDQTTLSGSSELRRTGDCRRWTARVGGCEDPNDTTTAGYMALFNGERCRRTRVRPFVPTVRISSALQQSIKRYFDAALVDGPSARWRWPALRSPAAAPVVYCGWVNSRNRFGGYVGWTPYIVRLSAGRVTSAMIAGRDDMQHVAVHCAEAGYDVTAPPSE